MSIGESDRQGERAVEAQPAKIHPPGQRLVCGKREKGGKGVGSWELGVGMGVEGRGKKVEILKEKRLDLGADCQ